LESERVIPRGNHERAKESLGESEGTRDSVDECLDSSLIVNALPSERKEALWWFGNAVRQLVEPVPVGAVSSKQEVEDRHPSVRVIFLCVYALEE
jgi:hypothetical protein